MSMVDGKWKVVEHRRHRRGVNRPERDGATFFFRNFPESCTEGELWRSFSKVGRVVDLYIPAKRDKLGKKFGFVRFQKFRDEMRLQQSLGGNLRH